MVNEDKSERLAFRMGPTDAAMLHELASTEGESVSTVLRMIIRRAYAEKFGDKKPKTKR